MYEYCITAGEGTLLALGSCDHWALTESDALDELYVDGAQAHIAHWWNTDEDEECPTGK